MRVTLLLVYPKSRDISSTASSLSGVDKDQSKIIHCDADCFYAAVEVRDNPKLAGRPIAVGGSSDRRGVISTCSYEARRFGVRSAMSTAHALRLCPDLQLLPVNMSKYYEVSLQMREIFFEYTDLVEPLALDEAFLDVSECSQHQGSATLIAQEIRKRIHEKTGVTVSAGVSNSKFLAKIASDWKKPDALFVIKPDDVKDFVSKLSVKKIHGVGKVTSEKLERLGIYECSDVQLVGLHKMIKHFGVFGSRLFDLAHGRDDRPVKPHRTPKSLSVEHTYSEDLPSKDSCLSELPELMNDLLRRLSKSNYRHGVFKAFAKLKFNDFSVTTIERVGTSPRISDYRSLLAEAFERGNRPVRLIGLGVRFRDDLDENYEQLCLFDGYEEAFTDDDDLDEN